MRPAHRPHSGTRAFTLVELLVVIGIIALLIGILLPTLGKARDHANAVVCQSAMKQFYLCWSMYVTDYKGYVLPAREKVTGAEYDWFEAELLGQELGRRKGQMGSTGTAREADMAVVVKQVLTCPAAEHEGQPTADGVSATGTATGGLKDYLGDYVYNTWMGYVDLTTIPPTFSNPFMKVGQVPGNVIIMMESRKPNFGLPSAANYKAYFQKNTEIFGDPVSGTGVDPKTGSGPTNTLTYLRIGTPHVAKSQMNVLCADGHIVQLDPKKSFFSDPKNMTTIKNKYFYWDAGDVNHSNWKKGVPDIQ